MGMIHTYNKKCEDTINHITKDNNPIINKYYQHSGGFIWYLNSKGYYHIWKPEKIETNCGIFKGMVHYRLTDNDDLKEIGYKLLDTKEKAEAFVKELLS